MLVVLDQEVVFITEGEGGGVTVQFRLCAAPMRGAHNPATGGTIGVHVFVARSDTALLGWPIR